LKRIKILELDINALLMNIIELIENWEKITSMAQKKICGENEN